MNLIYNFIIDNKLTIILIVATICSYVWLTQLNNRIKIKLDSNFTALIVSILHTIIGVLIVKFFAKFEVGFDMEKAGNMSIYGAVFFMPLFYFVYAKLFKVKMSVVFDIFVISLISTLMLARFNCILSGCCLGTQIFDTELLWPTREMEIFFYLILIYIFDKIISENKSYGNIYPIYMISYGIFRGLIEFLRVGEGLIHRAHYWSILSIIIGSIIVFVLNKQKRGK